MNQQKTKKVNLLIEGCDLSYIKAQAMQTLAAKGLVDLTGLPREQASKIITLKLNPDVKHQILRIWQYLELPEPQHVSGKTYLIHYEGRISNEQVMENNAMLMAYAINARMSEESLQHLAKRLKAI